LGTNGRAGIAASAAAGTSVASLEVRMIRRLPSVSVSARERAEAAVVVDDQHTRRHVHDS
jgi:hypothetical protein